MVVLVVNAFLVVQRLLSYKVVVVRVVKVVMMFAWHRRTQSTGRGGRGRGH